jgi:Divergent InlB B-repeat domain/Right handed beta helix region/GTA TIM-barrel-like domain
VQKQCRHWLTAGVLLLATATGVATPALAQINSLSFKGFNYVSYYNGGYANADSLPALGGTGANAVALSFEYGIDVKNSAVYADANYTESQSVIAATIAEAKSRGFSVMVRPLLDFLDPTKIGPYSVGDWRSTYNPTNPAAFFASYKTMIVAIAQMAQANGAASLSIGAELDQLTGPAYLSDWTDIITSVRAVFSGKLTYSADWDDNISPWQGQHGLPAGTGNLTTQVSFWSQLDYLGIDCYAPLSDAGNPTLAGLITGWTSPPSDPTSLAVTGNQSLISYFAGVATQAGKPLLFTEIGYESANDAAKQPSGTSTNVYDPALQANLYSAFFAAWQQSGNNSLLGVYFWNWDPNAAEVGPGNGPNFSPQGQPVQAVVTANFSAPAPALQVTPATNIASSGNQGGPFSPSSFAYQLQATAGSVGYAIAGVPSWLTASSTSGTVSTSATAVTFTINSGANTLSPATYNATITFTDTTNNNTVQTTTAVLTVNVLNPPITYTLSVGVSGNGTVTSSPSGISCPSLCTMNYSSGTPVMLTATPAGGSTFNGWGGACTGNGSCLLTMNALENVTAMFSASGGGGPSSQTFVSATLGSDANPCTRVSPCLTFAAALAQTSAGGEIDVLDPGDFGPVTITKAVSIDGDAVGVAGTILSPGTSGIVISAGSSDVINLRGLVFDGVNASGTSGVVFLSGARLNISNCVFQGFTASGMTLSPGTGSAATTRLVVQDTTILNNATGILIRPTGGITAKVTLRRLRIDNNTGEGLRLDGTGGSGAINAAISDSTASLNAGNGIDAVSGPGNATVDVMRVVAAANGAAGIQANQSSGGTASVTVGSAVIYGNAIGIQATSGAALLSYGNNQMSGNAANGSFTGGAILH